MTNKTQEKPQKWTDLASAVSFFDLVRSLNPESEEAQELRAKYPVFVESMSYDEDMKRLLEEENAIIPKRLETYVQNQAESKNRALVELVSNAVDASIERSEKIGRFGVGFYQVLSWLKDEGDVVTVETKKQEGQPIATSFRKADEGYQLHLERPEGYTSPKGTIVDVRKEHFSQDDQERLEGYLRKYMELNSEAIIAVNGRPINRTGKFRYLNGEKLDMMDKPVVDVEIDDRGFRVVDKGIGMDERTTLESLLIPKKSDKSHEEIIDQATAQQETKIFYRTEPEGSRRLTKSRARVQVNGVLIEDFEFEGVNLPEEMVIELPAESWLPESRNQIEVNRPVIEGMKSLIDKVTRQADVSDRYQLVNGLAAITRELQSRNTTSDNLLKHFYEKVEANLLQGQAVAPVPNTADFLRVRTQPKEGFEAVYLDDAVFKFKPSTLGLDKCSAFDSTKYQVVLADLDSTERTDDLYFTQGNTIVLDKGIYEKFKDQPAFLNALVNFHILYGDRPPAKGRFRRPLTEIVNEPTDDSTEERAQLERKIKGVEGRNATYLGNRIKAAVEAKKTLAQVEEAEEMYDKLVEEGADRHEIARVLYGFINQPCNPIISYSFFSHFGESWGKESEIGYPRSTDINKYLFSRIKERLNEIISMPENTDPKSLENLKRAEEIFGTRDSAERLSLEKLTMTGTPDTHYWHRVHIKGEDFYLNSEYCLIDAATVIYRRMGDQLVNMDLSGLDKPIHGVEFDETKEGILLKVTTKDETKEHSYDTHHFLVDEDGARKIEIPHADYRKAFASLGRELYFVPTDKTEERPQKFTLGEFDGKDLRPVPIRGSLDGVIESPDYWDSFRHRDITVNGYKVIGVTKDKTLATRDGEIYMLDIAMDKSATQDISEEIGLLLNERDQHFYTITDDGTPQRTERTAPVVDQVKEVAGRKILLTKVSEETQSDGRPKYGSQVYRLSELRDGEFIDESPFEEDRMKGDFLYIDERIGNTALLKINDENGNTRRYATENDKEI